MTAEGKRGWRWMLCVAGLALLVTGCAKDKAIQSVEDLNRKLGQAKDGCASVYAPDELSKVQGNVDEANRLKDDKKWKKALNQAEATSPDVDNLITVAGQQRESAQAEATKALTDAEAAWAEAEKEEATKYGSPYADQAKAKLAEANKLGGDPCKWNEATAAAKEAADLARRARNAAIAEKKRLEEERLRAEEARRRAEEEARRRAEEAARNAKPPVYVVKKGDYLWKISGMSQIYQASKYWPLIFDANRGKIQDPDLIYPDQSLTIPREMSDAEMMSKLRMMWSKAARGENL